MGDYGHSTWCAALEQTGKACDCGWDAGRRERDLQDKVARLETTVRSLEAQLDPATPVRIELTLGGKTVAKTDTPHLHRGDSVALAIDDVQLFPKDAETPKRLRQERDMANMVPGVMHCAKCKFQLQRTNLYMGSGTFGAGGNETEPCPNGCGPLWPVTWKQWAEEAIATNEQLHLERNRLREALEFYADPRRYEGPNRPPIEGDKYADPKWVYLQDVERDRGYIAHKALEGEAPWLIWTR